MFELELDGLPGEEHQPSERYKIPLGFYGDSPAPGANDSDGSDEDSDVWGRTSYSPAQHAEGASLNNRGLPEEFLARVSRSPTDPFPCPPTFFEKDEKKVSNSQSKRNSKETPVVARTSSSMITARLSAEKPSVTSDAKTNRRSKTDEKDAHQRAIRRQDRDAKNTLSDDDLDSSVLSSLDLSSSFSSSFSSDDNDQPVAADALKASRAKLEAARQAVINTRKFQQQKLGFTGMRRCDGVHNLALLDASSQQEAPAPAASPSTQQSLKENMSINEENMLFRFEW